MAELSPAQLLFRKPCEFAVGAPSLSVIPEAKLPEMAFIGRSNVGKSSLINAITDRKGLARTSNTPGRTQQLNFFRLNDQLWLVDLPGYGYAKASKTDVEAWNKLIRDYLRGRSTLARVFVLVDARHGVKPNDQEMMEMLDNHAVSYQLVLTKRDKIKASEIEAVMLATREHIRHRPAAHPEIILTSAETSEGIEQLQQAVYDVVHRTANYA